MTTLDEITYADWQYKLDTIGSVAEGKEDINQCIAIILLTPKGSVPHRPDFGSNIYKYIDYPRKRSIGKYCKRNIGCIGFMGNKNRS